ncbi:type II toxin-antitoxin system HicA family toxin [Moorena sp. SIO4A1]|uniref:type II toxin-antitoxin system HicA family toxin n=1 Tax=Moorena sp. SIO4A1 TaxID=2607835 RepID=UPI0025F88A83|nr:type II toxin-antitoxin system HicA family toxin [Moorena sp. SIO4A1]
MPAKAKTLEKVAKKLGFQKVRQKGSHARWKHPDGAMQRGLGGFPHERLHQETVNHYSCSW